MGSYVNLPPQQLPMSKKGKEWRKKHLDWADSKSFFNYNAVRKSMVHKKINYDLMNGVLHMQDMELILNPDGQKINYIPEKIQHYPIINSKLDLLRGEESKRTFDFRVIVTNPNSISEIEDNKRDAVYQMLQEFVQNQEQTEDEANKNLDRINDYFTYEWQDMREIRANALLNHYIKELDIKEKFNHGFMDALTVGEEIYKCDIVGGEPTFERINPLRISVFRSGYSNKIEDADIIVIEDYLPVGKIFDTYGEVLTQKDLEYLEKNPNNNGAVDEMDNYDERDGFINNHMIGDQIDADGEGFYFDPFNLFNTAQSNSLLPFDTEGNVRVLQMYWKSRRKIKKVKSYDEVTGEEVYTFYSENYTINKDLGEEETVYYINEAWEGTKIGKDIYVNMRPRPIQYNRLSNPSRCHFGIVGSLYNLNESRPFSMVDMMKPYSYLYDIVHDRLNKSLAKSWGKIIQLDLAKVPRGWDIDKWLYYAKTNNIAVVDSFKEGNIGSATGKLAGALNNNSTGVIDAELGQSIQQDIQLLEYIKEEMAEVSGVSKQREGQVSNRETVGGVERATLQSSHITEYLFTIHEGLKKRALECLLETAKIAMKGRGLKFSYILPDFANKIMDIDGDEFAENDYGLVVDNSDGIQQLNQKMDMLAQAALQNQAISFSTMMKLYGSSSMSEKQRMVEKEEREKLEQAQQQQQQELQAQQEAQQAQAQMAERQMMQQNEMNIRDNETKITVAQIQADNKTQLAYMSQPIDTSQEELELKRMTFDENKRQFEEKQRIERDRLSFDKKKANDDKNLKEKQISVQRMKKTSNS